MKFLKLIIFIITVLSIMACERTADISSPAMYEKQNIRFSYPGNWKVTEDIAQEDVRYLFVESPGDAIFIVQIYPIHSAVSLSEFAKWFSEQTKKEIPFGKISNTKFSVINQPIVSGMTGIEESFLMVLLSEKIPHIRKYYSIKASDKIAFLVSQTATKDLIKVEPGFNLILSSFGIE